MKENEYYFVDFGNVRSCVCPTRKMAEAIAKARGTGRVVKVIEMDANNGAKPWYFHKLVEFDGEAVGFGPVFNDPDDMLNSHIHKVGAKSKWYKQRLIRAVEAPLD